MQAPLSVLRTLKSKCQNALKAADESFQVTKNLFEKHNVVFTVGGGLLSAGAAWAGYTARQVHQRKLEAKLQKIEDHMTNVYSLEEQQVKALTTAAAKTGVSYKTFLATSSTALIIGYVLGFRSGRRFVIKRIPHELLLAAQNQKKDGKRSGLARLLPGRLVPSQPETSTFAPAAHQAAPALNLAAANSHLPGTSTMAQQALNSVETAPQESRSASADGGGDANTASGSDPIRSDREGSSDAVSGSEAGSPSRKSSQGAPSSAAVDLALGKTDIERQVDRALEPERKAAAADSHRTDKILQATIPNLNGGWDKGREEADRALEDNMGTSLDFRESENRQNQDVDGEAMAGGAAAITEAQEQDPVEMGEKRYTESLEEEEHTIEAPKSDRTS